MVSSNSTETEIDIQHVSGNFQNDCIKKEKRRREIKVCDVMFQHINQYTY